MRLSGTLSRTISTSRGLGNQLWDLAGNRPSLDLPFADSKSLVDATTGQNLVTFTRASSGRYTDSQGVIRTATTNLLVRSEDLTTTWSQYLLSSVTANTTVAPDGQTTADTVAYTADAFADINQGAASVVNGTTYTLSVWARSVSGTSSFRFKYWNGSAGVYSSAITVTETWQRYSYTFTATATSAGANVGFANTTAATRSVVFWGAQLEQSSTVGEYIPTTSTINSAPRFDHNPTTGESLGLLVEESRTNLLTYSEDVSQWASPFNTTLTTNSIAAPDGATTADRLLETTATNLHTCDGTAFAFVTGTTYTYSVFVKPIGNRNFEIAFPTTVFTARFARFTLSGSGSVQGTDAGVTASISSLQNGWYRCVATSTCASGAGSRIGNFINDSSNSRSYTGDTSAGIYIWGAQLEAGSFPTSYIPTTTATATRSADVASISGSNFSSWYRQDEGTVFVDARTNATHGGFNTFPRLSTLSDGTNNNAIENYLRVLSSYTDAGYRIATGGVVQAEYDTNNERNGQKQSVGYATNNFVFAVGGTIQNTDTSGSVPVIAQLRIGTRGDGSAAVNGTIRRLTYWPQRLSNSTLQSITQ